MKLGTKIVTKKRTAAILFAASLVLGACGSDSDGESGLESSSETTAAAETTTTVAEETTTTAGEETTTTAAPTTESTTTTAASSGSNESVDPALLEAMGMSEEEFNMMMAMLDTDAGRTMMADELARQFNISSEDALCFVENGDMLGLMAIGAGAAEVNADAVSDMMTALDTCGIPLTAITG